MPTTSPSDGGLWSPGRRALTIGLILTVTIVASEALAISTIMPVVADDLAAGSRTLYGWVFSAFLLSSLVGIVLAGLLIDRGSLATAFVVGLSLFCVGLVIGGVAPTMEVLVAGRALQGLGAGAVPAVAYVAIGRAMPEHLRPTMFATLSTAWVLPGVLGPFLAGVVAELFHWRLVFLGLLPLAAIAAAMTVPAIRSVRDAAGSEDERAAAARMRARLPLAVALAGGSGLMVAGLTHARPRAPDRRALAAGLGARGGVRADGRRAARRPTGPRVAALRRRPVARDPGVPAPHATGHAARRAGIARGGPPARAADVRVLLG